VRAPIRSRAACALTLLALLTAGCGGASSGDGGTGGTGSTELTFESSDGVTLAGRLFGPEQGTAGVVLAHMFPSDQSSWFPFADRLADRGYRVLTFNFRGYCPGGDAGCSEGERQIDAIWQDVEGAITALRDEGVPRIALIGASMGGTACLVAAAEEGADVDALVTLSAPVAFQGLSASPDVLSRVSAAKLFLAGHEDTDAAQSVDTFYAQSVQPKRPVILTTGDHGTDILSGNQAGIASTEILNWLDRYIPVNP
jgi:pimeloyl-ACP methyl ester carboxylesterase